MSKHPINVVVLISGNGSNLQAMIDNINAGHVDATISCVISNNADAYGLARAQHANIPTAMLNHKDYTDRASYDNALTKLIDGYQPDLVALAGFMRILGDDIVDHFKNRMINIHPSLLPKYRGLHTHEQVIANGDKEHGCSIHFVTSELDSGPVIKQAKLTVSPDDTVESLKQRIHQLEHKLYPEVIQWFAEQQS